MLATLKGRQVALRQSLKVARNLFVIRVLSRELTATTRQIDRLESRLLIGKEDK